MKRGRSKNHTKDVKIKRQQENRNQKREQKEIKIERSRNK